MQTNLALADIVGQITRVVGQLDPASYKMPLSAFNGSSLGQHFRHILEFFQCLERGVDLGVVDYASRERNLLYEENPGLALEAFGRFSVRFQDIDTGRSIVVRSELGLEPRPEHGSTVGREMVFVYDHAIHHLAIIKIGLQLYFPEVEAKSDLGVSPSTLKARQAKSS